MTLSNTVPPREAMDFDVLIVGAGPAGLSCAIRIKQRAKELGRDISVCVIDKGSEVGAHLMSGAVLEPRALDELLPSWRDMDSPVKLAVTQDHFMFLTARKALRLPTPPPMKNHGNYIISLGYFAKWLAGVAETLGVEIYAGFAAAEVLYNDKGAVIGVATGDSGVGKDGTPLPSFTRGVELRAKQTVFAEGCRGSLTKELFAKFNLRKDCAPQTFGLGIKEVWEIDPKRHRPGLVTHSVGWPMDAKTYGGSWLYHAENNLVSIGFVVGLDYQNPYLSPFQEFQRFKNHPFIKNTLMGGKRISYGARALSEGGLQSIPRLTFAGGLLIGDAAGFLNVAKIKGNHLAMKSGMVAGDALADYFAKNDGEAEVAAYPENLKKSWLWEELYQVRNIRPAFRFGLWAGLIYAAFDNVILRGRAPWTLTHHEDYKQLKPARDFKPIAYPAPDGVMSFDRLSSVFLSNTNHEENQPCHLKLAKPDVMLSVNRDVYASPETRYCPAGVYEVVEDQGTPRFVINAQNCVHCKTCDIKDPTQNINWAVPEGGGGPNYQGM